MTAEDTMNRIGRVSKRRAVALLMLVTAIPSIGLSANPVVQEKSEVFVRIEKALRQTQSWQVKEVDFDKVSTPPLDKIYLRSGRKRSTINLFLLGRVEEARDVFSELAIPVMHFEGWQRTSITGLGDENYIWAKRDSEGVSLHFRRGNLVVVINAPAKAAKQFAKLILAQAEITQTQ